MADGRPILSEYTRHGWHLVPIPHGKKGPVTARWNTRELTIADPEIAEWLDGNVGLAHAYSGTASIDIDDVAKATAWLSERGVDLTALLDAPDSVRIESRPGRAKLLYRVAKPLPSFKLPCGLELRCAASGGLTVQDVLPPSIHPDTGKPYTWRYGSAAGHWSLLPELAAPLAKLWLGLIKPQTDIPRTLKGGGTEAAKLRELVAGLDPDASYDEWVKVGMALHYETNGSQTGLALWNEWSATGKKYQGLGDLETHWRSFRSNHENPTTAASLRRDQPAGADEFMALDAIDSPMLPAAPARPDGPVVPKDSTLETLRSLTRSKLGRIEAKISNVVSVLGAEEISGQRIALDEFLDMILIARKGTDEWRPFNDTDYTAMRCWLETGGNCESIGRDMMRDAVHQVAQHNTMDSAQKWLATLTWDGVPRIDHFCPGYFGTLDTQYERAVGAYLWTALAGRILKPGVQADMVPVLVGKQGVGKSRGVQAMVPDPTFYAELRIDDPDDAIARKMRGVLVGEMAEMRGLRGTEIERVKAFITRTHEKWVPKYKEFATHYPRRFILIGTTNDEEFLPQDTEHRRWLPLHTNKVDIPAIVKDRDQLWAEGAVRYAEGGIVWQGMDALAADARAAAAGVDNWVELVQTWLAEYTGPHVTLHEIMTQAIGLDPRHVNRSQELRVGRVLRDLGYSSATLREGSRVRRVWRFDPTS